MYLHKKASSIIEAMVVLMIITSGVTWVYLLMSSSQKLANSTWNRIEAIQIARDWLEAMTNIRDTNWILYGADPANCWNTLNYSGSCVWNTTISTDIKLWANEAFRIYRDINNRFMLSATGTTTSPLFTNITYRNVFQVFKLNWFYTQSGGIVTQPLFTREIQIEQKISRQRKQKKIIPQPCEIC